MDIAVQLSMAKRSKGFRSKTRRKLKKELKEKFKPTDYLKDFKENDKIYIYINSSSQSGMPHRRYQGLTGKVTGKRGRAYLVNVFLGNREKTLIVSPEHIKAIDGAKSK